MRVVIKDIRQIFNERKWYKQLSRLFNRAAMGQHLLCIDGDPDEMIKVRNETLIISKIFHSLMVVRNISH